MPFTFGDSLSSLVSQGSLQDVVDLTTLRNSVVGTKKIHILVPKEFSSTLTSLPLLTELSLQSCTFEDAVSFHGIELKLVRLRLENIRWDDTPDEITLLCNCPLLKVLFLGWHYRIAHTMHGIDDRTLPPKLHDLTVTSANYSWSTNRIRRLQEEETFFRFITALNGLRRLTLNGGWPIFESEAFTQDKQAFPDDLEAYAGPIHFFRSTAPAHLGLKDVTFMESHLTISEIQDFLPSLPMATRVALVGVCLEEDLLFDETLLTIAFRRFQNVEEFLIDSAHIPAEGPGPVFDVLRQSIHMLEKIRYLIIPDIDAFDLEIEEAFSDLTDISPSLMGIQVEEQKWMYDGQRWVEVNN
ncbi:uncharacterized protein C8R40DRAFT_1068065 [Lentinula edodes]|uniref:uncharacterized protein n=1 Tax=Lentinula edodes TaxID=5353 RepID=UPI001E8EF1CD|nr:uncharacterized protein C8R40DRAFT_1068065 [Lentinula edodes]KAH7877365.1 hypothetical protein C8R40DRAFT_1068065 [Lentinula edodes]